MGSFTSDNFHAKKNKAMADLVKGKETAIQLQTLLHESVLDHGPVSVQELAVKIFRSFSDTLSELTSSTGSTQISAVDCDGSACSGESKKKRGVKDRRGCYTRRRTSDSWVTVSRTMEDGFQWRKYGQKTILNSEYPRCYFRCTHKHDGCKALKQVQQVKGDEILYQITYFNRHTCKESPPLMVDPVPADPNLISFQKCIPSKQDDENDHKSKGPSKPMTITLVKQEDSLSEETQSTLEDQWNDMVEIEPLGYKSFWAPFQDEVESASLHGLDIEVNKLSDIVNFHYFD